MTVRLRARLKSQALGMRKMNADRSKNRKVTPIETGDVIFNGKSDVTSIYERDHLVVGKRFAGPAVITEYSGTTVIPSGRTFSVDEAGNLLIRFTPLLTKKKRSL